MADKGALLHSALRRGQISLRPSRQHPQIPSDARSNDPAPNWPGGNFCPCHGSKYDLARRVFAGAPAPFDLPAPPYNFPNDKTRRVGENSAGFTFNFDSVLQV